MFVFPWCSQTTEGWDVTAEELHQTHKNTGFLSLIKTNRQKKINKWIETMADPKLLFQTHLLSDMQH